jgi:hypothetical protein
VSLKKTGNENILCHNRVSKYVNAKEYDFIKKELALSSGVKYEKTSVKDIILSGSPEKLSSGDTRERYIVRFFKEDAGKSILIKECTKGSKIKQITQPINYETVCRIAECSTKWLCTSVFSLIKELGLKMTTERLRPDTVMSFERESFFVENRVIITVDSKISVCQYESVKGISPEKIKFEEVDDGIFLLQINYERIIPENIRKFIGI